MKDKKIIIELINSYTFVFVTGSNYVKLPLILSSIQLLCKDSVTVINELLFTCTH